MINDLFGVATFNVGILIFRANVKKIGNRIFITLRKTHIKSSKIQYMMIKEFVIISWLEDGSRIV